MAELYHSIAVCFSTEDRGKTVLQWRVSFEDAHEFADEFRARFGEPDLEATSEAAAIDEMTRRACENDGHVVVTRV